MNTTSLGGTAESVARIWLESQGYIIIEQNWKTRWCEIDIVAMKNAIVYFVEVRHRKTNTWGDGIDSITNKKRKQVEFAAQFWMHQNEWLGDARIMLLATTGSPPSVTTSIEL